MKTLFASGLFAGLAMAGGVAQAGDETAMRGGQVFVERVAADFYESDLRLSQARAIEAATARSYLDMSASERARFRDNRRRIWRAMSVDQKNALKNVKRPAFANLTEKQKATFRRIAADQLAPITSLQETAAMKPTSAKDI